MEVWTPEKDTGTLVYQGTGQTYTDTGLNNGQLYTYTVYVIVAAAYTNGVETEAVPLAPVSSTFLMLISL